MSENEEVEESGESEGEEGEDSESEEKNGESEEAEAEGEGEETQEKEQEVTIEPVIIDNRIHLGVRVRPFLESATEGGAPVMLDVIDLDESKKEPGTEPKKKKLVFKHPQSQVVYEYDRLEHVHWSHTPGLEEKIQKEQELKLKKKKEEGEGEEEGEDSEEDSEEEEGEGKNKKEIKVIPHVDDSVVYEEVVKRLVEKFTDVNENATLFLYGGKKAGKCFTFKMILENVLKDLFEKSQSYFFTMYEMADDGAYDLLKDENDEETEEKKVPLQVFKLEDGTIEIPDISKQKMEDSKNGKMELLQAFEKKSNDSTLILQIENVEAKEKISYLTIVKLCSSKLNEPISLQNLVTVLKKSQRNLDVKEFLERKKKKEEEEGENSEDDSEEESSEEEEEGENKKEVVPVDLNMREIEFKNSFLTWNLKELFDFEKSWVTVYCLVNPSDWLRYFSDLKFLHSIKENDIDLSEKKEEVKSEEEKEGEKEEDDEDEDD